MLKQHLTKYKVCNVIQFASPTPITPVKLKFGGFFVYFPIFDFPIFCTMIGNMLTPLKVVITVEILGAAGIIFGFLPREAAHFLLGIFAYFALFAPRKDAVLFAVFSIPLYTALPITEGFDTMAGWRIIIAILFLRVLISFIHNFPFSFLSYFKRGKTRQNSVPRAPSLNVREGVGGESYRAQAQMEWASQKWLVSLLGLFFMVSTVSLLVAPEPTFGIRKLLFLANIFALFFVIQQVIKNKQDWLDVFKHTFAGALLMLGVGYAQFASIFFVSLHNFWMWWAHHFIPLFYGFQLEHLLSYSNTWFSYYENAEPTLRVFSVFPDSHSFALAMVLLLPMALTYYFVNKRGSDPQRLTQSWRYEIVIVLALLAIIFSGTRGIWAGSMPVFLTLILAYCVQKEFFRRNFPMITFLITRAFTTQLLNEGCRKILQTCIGALLVFAILFPVASQIQKIMQIRQGGRIADSTTFLRISKSLSTQELSNKGRIQIWKSTIASIAKHPFLGVGIGNYPVVLSENVSATKKGASAHSLYLDFIAEIGIFGGIVILLIFLEIFRRAIKIFMENKDQFFIAFSGFFAIFLLWVMAYSIVDVVLLNDKVLLLFVTLTALLYSIRKEKMSRVHIADI